MAGPFLLPRGQWLSNIVELVFDTSSFGDRLSYGGYSRESIVTSDEARSGDTCMQKFADRSVALSVHVGNASVHPGKVSTSMRGGICIPAGWHLRRVLVGFIEVGGHRGWYMCRARGGYLFSHLGKSFTLKYSGNDSS